MKHRTYLDIFSSWADVVNEFSAINAPKSEPRFVYAGYSYEDYSGSAILFYANTSRKISVLEGYHCSCNGLGEVPWTPNTYTSKQLRTLLDGGRFYGPFDPVQLREWIKLIEKKS